MRQDRQMAWYWAGQDMFCDGRWGAKARYWVRAKEKGVVRAQHSTLGFRSRGKLIATEHDIDEALGCAMASGEGSRAA